MELNTHSKQSPLNPSSSLAWQYGNLQISTAHLSAALHAYIPEFDIKIFDITRLLRSNITVLSHSERTAQDVLSLLHVAYIALNAIKTQLIRMKTLAEQAVSQNIDHAQLQDMNAEFQTLISEIICITQTTHFNGIISQDTPLKYLFNCKKNSLSTTLNNDNPQQTTLFISTPAGAQQALLAINEAITSQEVIRANLDGIQNRLKNTVNNLSLPTEEYLESYESHHKNSGITEMTAFVRNQILTRSTVDITDQSKAMPRMALHLLGNRR